MKKIMNKIVLIAISASMLTAILIGIPLSIFINDTFVGGYTDLEKLVRTGGIKELLHDE